MNLEAYLNRIRYTGPRTATLEVLNAVQAAHLKAIPYENLDIHLGRVLPLSVPSTFEKIVTQGRGGWCYEMNSLLGWALTALGFQVTYLSSGVLYPGGISPDGDHLVLLVTLPEGDFVTDAGFGDGPIHPLPLRPGSYTEGFLEYNMEYDGTHWLMRNHPRGGAGGFQFSLSPRQMEYFAGRCSALQTSPDSGFVRTTVCQRITEDAIYTLRGAVLSVYSRREDLKRTLENASEYRQTLREHFNLELPEAETLWQTIWARHLEWLQPESQI